MDHYLNLTNQYLIEMIIKTIYSTIFSFQLYCFTIVLIFIISFLPLIIDEALNSSILILMTIHLNIIELIFMTSFILF
jgi:hypothetical protein